MKFRIKSNECQDEFYVQYRRWWWPFWATDTRYETSFTFKTLAEAQKRIAVIKMRSEPDHVAYVSD